MHKQLVDVHIEKTAGRSKRLVLLSNYGAENVFHYDPTTDRVVRASERLIVTEKPYQERVQAHAANPLLFPIIRAGYLMLKAIETRRGTLPEEMPGDFSVVTGHLTGGRFADITPPEATAYTAVLRDPLERMRSHYEHWARTRGLARFRVRPTFDPNLGFEEFALLPEMHNYQRTALGIDPSRFKVLGTTSMLPEYLEELGLLVSDEPVPHINRTAYPAKPQYDPGFVRDFQEVHATDYELYVATAESWQGDARLSA